MTTDGAPPIGAAPHRVPSGRGVRIRRRVSLILSVPTTIVALATLLVWVTRLDSGPSGLSAVETALWNAPGYGILPAAVSLALLSRLPRPERAAERAPQILGIIALVASALTIAYPAALTAFHLGSFLILVGTYLP